MSEDSTVVERRRDTRSAEEPRLFSLVEVAQETGIAMPILLRYKREHPERIPASGSGSQQRFPEEAFQIFRQIQREEAENRDLPRRGGFGLLSLPRVRRAQGPEPEEEAATEAPAAPALAAPSATRRAVPAPAPARKPAAPEPSRRAPAAAKAEVASGAAKLTLGDIAAELGVPYPTLARYSNQHEDRIPHVGSGRNRRFPPEAVEAFRRIRAESRPGRPPKVRPQPEAAAPQPSPRPAPTPAPAPTRTAPPVRQAAQASPAAPAAVRETARDDDDLSRRIASLERSQQALEQEIRSLVEALARPVTATLFQA